MTNVETLGDFIRWTVIGLMIIVFAYGVARVVSFAWFRTKYEHFLAMMKAMKEGDK